MCRPEWKPPFAEYAYLKKVSFRVKRPFTEYAYQDTFFPTFAHVLKIGCQLM